MGRVLRDFTRGTGALAVLFVLMFSWPAAAGVFGNVRGVVHDPQHHPVGGAQVTLKATDSAYTQGGTTSATGEFYFDAVPLGKYTISVEAPGFAPQDQSLVVVSGSAP